jgi:hypothetical protein
MKAQALEVSDDEVIAQAIKALCAGLQHFRKHEQQRKISKPYEAPRPHHNESQCNHPKPTHNINSNGCGPAENWEKNYGTLSQQTN